MAALAMNGVGFFPIPSPWMGANVIVGVAFFLVYWFGVRRIHPWSRMGILLRATLSLGMLALFVAIITSPNLVWSLSLQDFIHNAILARVTECWNTAHVGTYLTIPVLYFIALWISRNEFFSFAYATGLVFVHEFIWVFGDFAGNPLTLTNAWSMYGEIAFAAMVLSFGLVLLIVYKFWKAAWAIGFSVIYHALWVLNGWKITVTIGFVNGIPSYVPSRWYLDPYTNFLEMLSWVSLFVVMIVVLKYERLLPFKAERILTVAQFARFASGKTVGWFK